MVKKFRSVYDLENRKRVSTTFKCDDITNPMYIDKTKQSFAANLDVNNIVKLHPNLDPSEVTDNQIKTILANPDLYGEYDSEHDFATALNIVNRAKEQFDTLPSALRRRFKEDPYEFLSYVNDKNNLEEMKSFGLLKEEIPSTNIPVVETQQNQVIQPSKKVETQQSSTVEPTP